MSVTGFVPRPVQSNPTRFAARPRTGRQARTPAGRGIQTRQWNALMTKLNRNNPVTMYING